MPERTIVLYGRGGRRSAGLFAGRRCKPISPRRRRLSCSYKHAEGNNAGETEGQTQIHSTAEISHRSPPDVSVRGSTKERQGAASAGHASTSGIGASRCQKRFEVSPGSSRRLVP